MEALLALLTEENLDHPIPTDTDLRLAGTATSIKIIDVVIITLLSYESLQTSVAARERRG